MTADRVSKGIGIALFAVGLVIVVLSLFRDSSASGGNDGHGVYPINATFEKLSENQMQLFQNQKYLENRLDILEGKVK